MYTNKNVAKKPKCYAINFIKTNFGEKNVLLLETHIKMFYC